MNDSIRGIIRESLLSGLFFAACMAAVYTPLLIALDGGMLPGMYDLYRYFTPHAYLMDVALDQGSPPWWNPLSFCGTPLAANPQAAVFYAPNVLRSVLTPQVTPLNAYFGLLVATAIHSLAAGLGMYFLARRHRLGMPASLVAGLLFIFSLAFVRRALAYHFITAVAWFPFVLLFLDVALTAHHSRRRAVFAVGAGLCLGMSVLSGFFQIEAYMGLLMVGYWLALRLLRFEALPENDAPRPGHWLIRDLAVLAIIGCVTLAVSAVQLVPAWEFMRYTARATDSNMQEAMMQYELSVRDFLNSMAGTPALMPFLNGVRFAGVAVYLFVALSFLGSRKHAAAGFGLLALALTDCTLGPPFPLASLIDVIVPFKMAYTDRALIVVCIPLALLGAIGFETAVHAATGRIRYLRLAVILVLCSLLAYFHASRSVDDPILGTALLCLMGVAAVLIAATWVNRPRLWAGVLVGLLVIEIVSWNFHYIPRYLDREYPFTKKDVAADQQPFAPGNARRFEPLPNRHLLHLQAVMNGYDPLYLVSVRSFVCRPDQEGVYDRVLAPSYSVPTGNRRLDLLVKRRFWLTRDVETIPMPPKVDVFSPTTTAFLPAGEQAYWTGDLTRQDAVTERADDFRVDDLPVEETTRVTSGLGTVVPTWRIHVPSAKDREPLHRVLEIEYQSTASGLLEVYLNDTQFSERVLLSVAAVSANDGGTSRFSVSLPEYAFDEVNLVLNLSDADAAFAIDAARLNTDLRDEGPLITIASDRFDGVALDTGPLPGRRMLVFTDAYYPGWHACVDGVEAHLFRVDEVFKGVEVPAGEHRVEFRFRPSSVYAGMALSGGALIAICVYLIWPIIMRRGSRPG